jgi:hypothetical protein
MASYQAVGENTSQCRHCLSANAHIKLPAVGPFNAKNVSTHNAKFCQYECALAWMLERPGYRNHLVMCALARESFLLHKKPLVAAAPQAMLKAFGGVWDATEMQVHATEGDSVRMLAPPFASFATISEVYKSGGIPQVLHFNPELTDAQTDDPTVETILTEWDVTGLRRPNEQAVDLIEPTDSVQEPYYSTYLNDNTKETHLPMGVHSNAVSSMPGPVVVPKTSAKHTRQARTVIETSGLVDVVKAVVPKKSMSKNVMPAASVVPAKPMIPAIPMIPAVLAAIPAVSATIPMLPAVPSAIPMLPAVPAAIPMLPAVPVVVPAMFLLPPAFVETVIPMSSMVPVFVNAKRKIQDFFHPPVKKPKFTAIVTGPSVAAVAAVAVHRGETVSAIASIAAVVVQRVAVVAKVAEKIHRVEKNGLARFAQ